MILFIRRIPKGTLPSELREWVMPALQGSLFAKSALVEKVEILAIQDQEKGSIEFHGLIHIDSEQAGLRAIKRLRGQRIKGMPVQVREYQQRDWHRDRRLQQTTVSDNIVQQRRGDRRRRGTVIATTNIASIMDIFTSYYPEASPIGT